MNIQTKPNNILFFKENDYILYNTRILGESQILANTDKGSILLDLSCTINEIAYDNATSFCSSLGVPIIDEPTQEELIAQKEAELLEMFEELKRLKTNG